MVKVFGGGEGEGAEFAYYAVSLTVSFNLSIPLLHPMASCNLDFWDVCPFTAQGP